MAGDSTRHTIVSLCNQFYSLGWMTGTGGAMCIVEDSLHEDNCSKIYVTPSSVQKECLLESDIFMYSLEDGGLVNDNITATRPLKVSSCKPLFMRICR